MIAGGEIRAVLAVGLVCTLVLAAGEVLHRRFALAPEWTRKLVHVLMGLVASAFPWVFGDVRSVLFLCAAFAVVLCTSLRARRLPSVHRVERRTAGAVCFPVAVAVVFVGTAGRPEPFVTSILILTLADPAAALVGRRWGTTRYGHAHDARSLEGSLAFLTVASTVVWAALVFTTPLGAAAATAWALAIGIVLAGVEAVSPAGTDNVLIPVGSMLCLRVVDPAAPSALFTVMAFVALVAVVALCFRDATWERAHA